MGLGKTVQSMAVMIANRPSASETRKSTLIVSTPAIIRQWDDELEAFTSPDLFGHIMKNRELTKGPARGASGRGAVGTMEKSDIVFATYSEVIRSYPKCKVPKEMKKMEDKESWWYEHWNSNRGLLHRVQFYRVILDGDFQIQVCQKPVSADQYRLQRPMASKTSSHKLQLPAEP